MTFLQSLAGGGCCCAANETAQVIDVNATSEADEAAIESVEEASPVLTVKMARVMDVDGISEADVATFEPVEEASPFLTVKLARAKDLPIGLDVDMLDGVSLVVDRIKEGFVKSWNEENPEMAIQVHDRIIEVNGTRFNAQALAAELNQATEWDMRITRPTHVSVSVEQHEPKAALGVDLRPWRGQLLIAKISEGVLQDWLVANPSAGLQQYDRIMQVNGIRGSSHKLLRALHASEASTTLELEVLHYSALPDHFGKQKGGGKDN